MTAEELMGQYKKVREEEGINGGLGLITNPQAQVGGMLLVGLNPSGEGDRIQAEIGILQAMAGGVFTNRNLALGIVEDDVEPFLGFGVEASLLDGSTFSGGTALVLFRNTGF